MDIEIEFNPLSHYDERKGPTSEFGNLPEITPTPLNIGWTLGNDCPYRCTHCYSMNAREKGMNLSKPMIDRVVSQLVQNGIETVNLGGNEPLFTNGPKAKDSLLPYIIDSLDEAGIIVGLTTSGITVLHLEKYFPAIVDKLNDCDVSFDSPFEAEHNKNRDANIFHQAIDALELLNRKNIPHTIITAAMSWNFSKEHIAGLLKLAREHNAFLRINPLKPTLPEHIDIALGADQYYEGFSYLMSECSPIDLGEPPLAAVTEYEQARRCPCGRTSFRIHSITPKGEVYVSPCVYLHDYKSEFDLMKHDLKEIINSPQFRVFRQRNANPEEISGCAGCDLASSCGGGCAGRSYLYSIFENNEYTFKAKDPYCPKEFFDESKYEFKTNPTIVADHRLVHMDYLCTWIGNPNA